MLEFNNISKSFSGVEVLHQVSFKLENAKIIALVGENGAGKSTLMKILCGILPEYQGEIYMKGNCINLRNPRDAEQEGISMIHQELNLIPDLSVGENIFLGREPIGTLGRINFKQLFNHSDLILKEFDFPYHSKMKVRNLPVGWQQMVEVAKALQVKANLLVMDEPTSALSNHEIRLLFQRMKLLKSRGKTIIFISHRLREVFEIADEIAVLRDGFFVGKFAKNDITREKLISLMIGHDVPEISLSDSKKKDSTPVLKLNNLSVNIPGDLILSNIQFTLNRGHILGIAGLLGSGRTELLKFLYGEIKCPYQGQLEYKNRKWLPRSASDSIKNKIVYLSEDRKTEGIFPDHHVQFNSSISFLGQLSKAGFIREKQERKSVITKFDELKVRRHSLGQKIPTLSGGNQQKVLLSRILLLNPDLLLLDEPTRGIDVGAKEEIYQLIYKLSERGASIIMTSSEIPELLRICGRIVVLSQGKQTAILNASKTNPQEILNFAFKQD